jgi:hypothetical protein
MACDEEKIGISIKESLAKVGLRSGDDGDAVGMVRGLGGSMPIAQEAFPFGLKILASEARVSAKCSLEVFPLALSILIEGFWSLPCYRFSTERW